MCLSVPDYRCSLPEVNCVQRPDDHPSDMPGAAEDCETPCDARHEVQDEGVKRAGVFFQSNPENEQQEKVAQEMKMEFVREEDRDRCPRSRLYLFWDKQKHFSEVGETTRATYTRILAIARNGIARLCTSRSLYNAKAF